MASILLAGLNIGFLALTQAHRNRNRNRNRSANPRYEQSDWDVNNNYSQDFEAEEEPSISYVYRSIQPRHIPETGFTLALEDYADLRVLELLPSTNRSSIIRYKLRPYHLFPNDTARYPRDFEALSYTWGSSDRTHYTICDGREMMVTANLHAALLRLRRPFEPRMLWIDAVCINQEDLEEKTQQLNMMEHIYGIAYGGVIVYLGEESSDSSLALDFARHLLSVLKSLPIRYQISYLDFKMLGLPQKSSGEWAALKELLNRPWFHRKWIIQEFTCARNVTMICGNQEFAPSLFVDLFEESARHGLESIMTSDGSQNLLIEPHHPFKSILDIRVSVRAHFDTDDGLGHLPKPTDKSVAQLLIQTRAANVTNKHDAIYAMWGIFNEMGAFTGLMANYSQPVSKTYTEWTASIDWSTENSSLLSLASLPKEVMALPSWVPDWSCLPRRQPLSLLRGSTSYNTSGIRNQPPFSFDVDGGLLSVRAAVVDVVDKIAAVSWKSGDGEPQFKGALQEVITNLEVLTSGRENYPTRESWFDVKWKTLTGDQDDTQKKAPKSFGRTFDSFKKYLKTSSENDSSQMARLPSEFHGFVKAATNISVDRKLCLTKRGYLGQIPIEAQSRDSICIFPGEVVPFVIRRSGEHWKIVGDAYIHGIMYGELFKGPCPNVKIETMTLA
jgi:hypothetical protein